MSANHEVGTGAADRGRRCCRVAAPAYRLLVDAAQSFGRCAVPRGLVGPDRERAQVGLSPVGLLAVRAGMRYDGPATGFGAVGRGGGGICGLAALDEADHEAVRLPSLVDRIRATVAAIVPDVEVVGDPIERLPHLVTFSCLYVDGGQALLHALDRRGFAVSSDRRVQRPHWSLATCS